jgi:hypothetical protein
MRTVRPVDRLNAAAIATIREAALRLGTQDAEAIRQAVSPKMSRGHWARLLSSAGILS